MIFAAVLGKLFGGLIAIGGTLYLIYSFIHSQGEKDAIAEIKEQQRKLEVKREDDSRSFQERKLKAFEKAKQICDGNREERKRCADSLFEVISR